MTRLFMGWKSGVGSVLKVMANDTDDPLTTPNMDYAKFRFNSETGKIGYIYDTFSRVPYSDTTYPPGSNISNPNNYAIGSGGLNAAPELYSSNGPGNLRIIAFNLTGMGLGFVPIFEAKFKNSAGRYTKQKDNYVETSGFDSGSYYWYGNMSFTHSLGGSVKSKIVVSGAYFDQTINYLANPVAFARLNTTTAVNTSLYWGNGTDHFGCFGFSSAEAGGTMLGVVWDLPAGNVALQAPATPVSGQKMILMSPSIVKVSMPGFDVDTATRRQMIIDSSRVPAKIIKCGEVTVAGGGSATVTVDSAFPLNGNVYVDYIGWESGYPLYIPSYRPHAITNFSSSEAVFEYTVSTNSVTFYNTRSATFTLRYMIVGDDDAAPSSGGGKVLETGAGFQRILRPGANISAPSWSDILLDTRLAYLPILAEGYEAVSGFTTNTTNTTFLGTKVKSVGFSNGGLKPFAKVSVEYDNGAFHHPFVGLSLSNEGGGLSPKLLRHSSLCELTDTSITFRCHPTGVSTFRFNPSTHGWVSSSSGPTPIGFRYYILGLPIA